MPQVPGAQLPARPRERTHRAAAARLEVSRHGEEDLRGGERVALGHVRAMRRQAERRGDRGEAHVPGSRSPRSMLSSRQSTAVSTIRRGRGQPGLREKRALDPAGMHHRDPPGASEPPAAQAPPAPAAPRRGPPSRRPWISMEAPWRPPWTDETADRLGGDDPAADSIGMPANEITSSRRGSSPVVSTSIAMNRASRHEVPPRACQRSWKPYSLATPRWTRATARNASFSEVRASGAESLGLDQVVGRPRPRAAARPGAPCAARRTARRRRAASSASSG